MLESSNTDFQFFFEEMSIFVVVSVTYLFYICLCHPVLLIVVCVCATVCECICVCNLLSLSQHTQNASPMFVENVFIYFPVWYPQGLKRCLVCRRHLENIC